jgi:hypothetical protein
LILCPSRGGVKENIDGQRPLKTLVPRSMHHRDRPPSFHPQPFIRSEKVDRASLSSKCVSLSGKFQVLEGDRD